MYPCVCMYNGVSVLNTPYVIVLKATNINALRTAPTLFCVQLLLSSSLRKPMVSSHEKFESSQPLKPVRIRTPVTYVICTSVSVSVSKP